MANKLYEENDVKAIADAIRAKGITGTMKIGEMAEKINTIPGGTTFETVEARLEDLDGGIIAHYMDEDGTLHTLGNLSNIKVNVMKNSIITFSGADKYSEGSYCIPASACDKINRGSFIIKESCQIELVT